jgi:hypothetical protein
MSEELASGVRRREIRLPVHQASIEGHETATAWPVERNALYPLGLATRRVLVSLVDGLCPASPAPRDRLLLARVADGAQRVMRHMHPTVARGLALWLLLMDWLPILLLTGVRRLHRLPPDKIRQIVARCARSRWMPIRLAINGVRGVVLGIYFDQREVHGAIGYFPGVHIAERTAMRRALLSQEAISAAE